VLWRIVVIVGGLGFVAYRVALWLEVRKARRSGDTAREQHLRTHGFGLYRWAALAVVVFTILLAALVWANSR
jgi:hypothetical protein